METKSTKLLIETFGVSKTYQENSHTLTLSIKSEDIPALLDLASTFLRQIEVVGRSITTTNPPGQEESSMSPFLEENEPSY